MMVVFARNLDSNQIECFILDDLTQYGITREKIENKMSLRAVMNMQLYFHNVRIPENQKLPGVRGFGSVAKLLAESRMYICYVAAGIGLGVYDYMIKYLDERTQFGKKLTSYQLIQQKVVHVMSDIQAALFMVIQMIKLHEQKKLTIGKIAMTKAWVTKTVRNAARTGRESLGGNGIITTNYLMKAMMDIEAIYTYEGTYDINLLVAGRELTGKAAFKARDEEVRKELLR